MTQTRDYTRDHAHACQIDIPGSEYILDVEVPFHAPDIANIKNDIELVLTFASNHWVQVKVGCC